MKRLLLGLVAGVLLLSTPAASTASAQSPLSGDIPASGGIGLAVYAGGSVGQLTDAAAAHGCALSAVWLTVGGNFVGHVVGAPAFVNQDFTTRVGTTIASGSPVLIVCKAGGVPSTLTPVSALLLRTDDFAPGASVADEGCLLLGARVDAARIFDGTAGYLEYDGQVLVLASSDAVVHANADAAATRLDMLREGGTDRFIQDLALLSGVEFEEYQAQVTSAFYQDLTGDGLHGAYFELDFVTGVTLEAALLRVEHLLLQVSTLRITDDRVTSVDASSAFPLVQLQIPRAEAALIHGIDTSACFQ